MKFYQIVLLLALPFATLPALAAKSFSFHLSSEPSSLDPQKTKSAASSYLLNTLHRNLFRYDDDKGLVPELGEKCISKEKSLTCTLKKNLKFSDGTPLVAQDFLNTYKKLLSPEVAAPRADLLFKIANAKEFYEGKVPFEKVGITAPDPRTLKYTFSTLDPEFQYHLANFILAPTKTDPLIGTGPYRLADWKKGEKILLESNKHYVSFSARLPAVEVLFIEEDSVALQLYEKGQLSFLRRLPTLFIPQAKSRMDFHWIPVLRFDYLGFGPQLKDQEDVRRSLIYSLNYPELMKIFSAEGLPPGCAGLPKKWFPQDVPCFEYDLKKVTKKPVQGPLKMTFSSLGGEDHKRATEWMQNQWIKNAGLQVELEGKENKIFLSDLKKNPSAIFRKGIGLDRPTCLAALEQFGPEHPENFIRLSDPLFTKISTELAKPTSTKKSQQLCLEGVDFLMSRHLLIPLGPIHFAILAKKDFTGWKLNQMNQLDLSDLRSAP